MGFLIAVIMLVIAQVAGRRASREYLMFQSDPGRACCICGVHVDQSAHSTVLPVVPNPGFQVLVDLCPQHALDLLTVKQKTALVDIVRQRYVISPGYPGAAERRQAVRAMRLCLD